MNNLIIIGTSTTAKTAYRFVKKYNLYNVIGFAVHENLKDIDSFCDLPVYSIESLEKTIDKEKTYLFVAILWNNLNAVRKKLYEELKSKGYRLANLISPTAIINGEIKGDNCWVRDLAIVDFGTAVEENVFIKAGAWVGPNCLIKKHTFIGAKSTMGGASILGEQSFIGINALLFDEVKIGKKCIIGAGSIVKRSLPNYTLCKAQVDNMIVRQYTEFEIEEKLIASKNVRN